MTDELTHDKIQVLDHGYIKFIESWGTGEAGVLEAGIIEAARQSTQASFRGWDVWVCSKCGSEFPKKLDGVHFDQQARDCHGILSNDEALLNFLFNSNPQHSTPFEFGGIVIEIQAPILVFREWHRHRTQSYNEMSARYAALPNFNYVPTFNRLFDVDPKNRQAQAQEGAEPLTEEFAQKWLVTLQEHYETLEEFYQLGLRNGVPKELARVAIPVGRYSRMRAAMNLRNALAFLTLRYHPKAQKEIQAFAGVFGDRILKHAFPRTYGLFENKRGKAL